MVWDTQVLDYRTHPAHHTSGPIVANGKVVSGRGCLPKGGPDACVVTAHDARTGEELWRTRLIPAPGEPGDETWGGVPYEKRRHVGAWMVPSFDPALNLIYVGTSVTSPSPKFMAGGVDKQHLYHNSTLALDADTGEIRWYYQHLNDHWDLDHPFERLLVDTAVSPSASAVSWINPRLRPGERRKVVTGIPGKTGVVYTLDRETGEFLWATPTVGQNVISSIDGATGAVTENSEVVFSATGQSVTTCPTWYGGKNWEAGAYSPLTNAMYFPLRNTCSQVMAVPEEENPVIALTMREEIAPGTDQLGTVQAISVETGETLWRYEQRAAPRHWWRRGVASSLAATRTGGSGPWTRTRATCCGRSISALRLRASPSPTPWMVASMWREHAPPARRTPRFASRPSCGRARATTSSCSPCPEVPTKPMAHEVGSRLGHYLRSSDVFANRSAVD